MEGMQGWPAQRKIPMPEQSGPPPSVGRIGTQGGATSFSLGLIAFLIGSVLVVYTVRNPSFDPSQALRAPILELGAAFEVPQSGDYVAYVESTGCGGSASIEFVQVGQPVAESLWQPSGDFPIYSHDALCGTPVGVFALPTIGKWTATTTRVDGGKVALYPADDPPDHVLAGPVWIGGLLVLVGAVLLARGLMQHRRWRRSTRALA
jgi:hypothetical protein